MSPRLASYFNVVDVLVLAFLVVLVPVGYSSWLMFRPARPQIESVQPSDVTWAEERIAAGQPIRLKVKIRGSGLTPTLRPYIGTVPAIGFTFEGPTSGDVIIGENVPAGRHDLVLYNGTTEVARAANAVTIAPQPGVPIRVVGAFTLMDETTARSLRVGQVFMADGRTLATIATLGEMAPDRRILQQKTGAIETTSPGSWSRGAVVRMQCDPSPDVSTCRVGGNVLSDAARAVIAVPGSSGSLRLRVDAVVPDQAPTFATARVRVARAETVAGKVKEGDREIRWSAMDERAATVTRAASSAGSEIEFTVRLGLDATGHGWRYHNDIFAAGEPFTLVTDNYSVIGTVMQVVIDER